jgi:hypothetical protein
MPTQTANRANCGRRAHGRAGGATVKLIVTSADVIHSWGIPAFW